MSLVFRDGGNSSDSGDDCILTCPAPVCQCDPGQTCSFTPRFCDQCSQAVCADPQQASSGLSTGALAGAVVAVVLVALIAVGAYLWWRRKQATQRTGPPRPADVPARPDAVLSRPDPVDGQPPITPMRSVFDETSIRSTNADTDTFAGHNPFADQASIQTASARTHSPNVITIGLIPPPDGITALSPPPRPLRSPQFSLRPDGESVDLAHINVSEDSLQPPNARFAHRSSRQSAITTSSVGSAFSNASSAFDVLTETPTIVTPARGAVRQVLGVVKAEVVQAPLHSLSHASSRPTMKSPLSKASFGPDDVNPFGDDASSRFASSASSVKSTSTFGQHTPTQWTFPPAPPGWSGGERPLSTQSGTGTIIADIGSATRVVLGMTSPATYSDARMTRGTLTSVGTSAKAPSTRSVATFDDDELADPHRLSSTSSRADSILEAFPFVPPSPIAARPPRSPLGSTFTPPSPRSPRTPRPAPPPQRISAASAASGLSGLGAFPFHLGDDSSAGAFSPPPPSETTTASGARASLDTIALMRDLEAFPLPFGDPLRDNEPSSPHGSCA